MKKLGMFVAFALLLAFLVFPADQASAGQHVNEPAPNGVSPWAYNESWRLDGSWYGEGLHTDQYNDYYALDFGAGLCNKPLYPMYNNMTVVYKDATTWGRLDLEVTINGVKYKTKYLHMSSISVNVGAVVGTNTVVGYSGAKQTGTCHLHLNAQKLKSDGLWWGVPPTFCGRQYPHDHTTYWPGC